MGQREAEWQSVREVCQQFPCEHDFMCATGALPQIFARLAELSDEDPPSGADLDAQLQLLDPSSSGFVAHSGIARLWCDSFSPPPAAAAPAEAVTPASPTRPAAAPLSPGTAASGTARREDAAELLFRGLDDNRDGVITQSELRNILGAGPGDGGVLEREQELKRRQRELERRERHFEQEQERLQRQHQQSPSPPPRQPPGGPLPPHGDSSRQPRIDAMESTYHTSRQWTGPPVPSAGSASPNRSHPMQRRKGRERYGSVSPPRGVPPYRRTSSTDSGSLSPPLQLARASPQPVAYPHSPGPQQPQPQFAPEPEPEPEQSISSSQGPSSVLAAIAFLSGVEPPEGTSWAPDGTLTPVQAQPDRSHDNFAQYKDESSSVVAAQGVLGLEGDVGGVLTRQLELTNGTPTGQHPAATEAAAGLRYFEEREASLRKREKAVKKQERVLAKQQSKQAAASRDKLGKLLSRIGSLEEELGQAKAAEERANTAMQRTIEMHIQQQEDSEEETGSERVMRDEVTKLTTEVVALRAAAQAVASPVKRGKDIAREAHERLQSRVAELEAWCEEKECECERLQQLNASHEAELREKECECERLQQLNASHDAELRESSKATAELLKSKTVECKYTRSSHHNSISGVSSKRLLLQVTPRPLDCCRCGRSMRRIGREKQSAPRTWPSSCRP